MAHTRVFVCALVGDGMWCVCLCSRVRDICTILTSDSELILRTYIVTPTSTGGPEKHHKGGVILRGRGETVSHMRPDLIYLPEGAAPEEAVPEGAVPMGRPSGDTPRRQIPHH